MSNQIIRALIFFVAIVFGGASAAGEISFFHRGIDYWKTSPDAPPRQSESSAVTAPAANDSQAFPWERYLDPNTPEFFREGDYLPPAPFMEIVRHPTNENLAYWFSYIGKKNALAERLSTRMQEFSTRSGKGQTLAATGEEASNTASKTASDGPLDTSRFVLRFFFDPHCPHCHRMMATMVDLARRGVVIEGRQVGDDSLIQQALPFPLARAGPDEVAKYQIESVPLLLIADRVTTKIFRMKGFVPVSDLVAQLRRLSQ